MDSTMCGVTASLGELSSHLSLLPNWLRLQLTPVSGRCRVGNLQSLEGHIIAEVQALQQINPGIVLSAPNASISKAVPALEQGQLLEGWGFPCTASQTSSGVGHQQGASGEDLL